MKAYVQLENGKTFVGSAFGAVDNSVVGEVIFNTAMIGHQEIITDPSNYKKIITMTYPLIGNYGFNLQDDEYNQPVIGALLCRRKSDHPNNFRCEINLDNYLKYYGVLGVEGIDTRELTKILRDEGSMRAIISLKPLTESVIQEEVANLEMDYCIEEVTCPEVIHYSGTGERIAVWDFGCKKSLLEYFINEGLDIVRFPSMTSYEEILKVSPKAVLLSTGPGNPMQYLDIINDVKELLGEVPLFGVGMGAEFLALALGAKLYRMDYGHRGVAYPVRDQETKRVYMTAQNHQYGFSSLPEGVEMTFQNLNDNSIAGFESEKYNAAGILFQPEGAPGPTDTIYVYDKLIQGLNGGR